MMRIDGNLRMILEWARGRIPQRFIPIVDAARHGNEELQAFVVEFVRIARTGDLHGLQKLFSRFPDVAPAAAESGPEPQPVSVPEPQQVPEPRPESAPPAQIAPMVRVSAPAPAYRASLPDRPLTPHEMRKLVQKRAEGVKEPQADEPEKIIEHIFDADGIRFSQAVRDGGIEKPTLREEVEAMLVERMARAIIRSLRPGRAPLEIPKPPLSEEFPELIGKKLGAQPSIIDAWMQSGMWKNVLVTLFTAFLAEGVGPIDRENNSLARERRSAIDLKAQWYHKLEAIGMDIRDVGKAFESHYGKKNEEAKLRIVAEYSRLDPKVREYLQGDAISIQLLMEDMRELHIAEPGLDGDSFLSLLTPYLEPMTAEEIGRRLKQGARKGTEEQDVAASDFGPVVTGEGYREATKFERFVAQNILAWHTEDPYALAGRLEIYIANQLKYSDMQTFCLEELYLKRGGRRLRRGRIEKGVPSAFMEKMRDLEAKGVDIRPLIAAIEKSFPGSLPVDFMQMSIESVRPMAAGPSVDAAVSADAPASESAAEGADVALGESSMAGSAEEPGEELLQQGIGTFVPPSSSGVKS
ncbi:MAG: hypothetical protein WC956_05300 [bacterium]